MENLGLSHKPDVDTLSIDDLYNNLRVFEQELTSTSKSSASAQNVAFVSHSKSNTNKVKSGHTGAYSTYTPSTSSNNIPEREVLAWVCFGFVLVLPDEVIDGHKLADSNDCYSNEEVLQEDWKESPELKRKQTFGFNKKNFNASNFTTQINSFKGVPHPLSWDYTPKPQQEIDESLYVYGKKGPQKPEISNSDDTSNEHSTCQSNDSEGSFGKPSEHSSESESESISVPNEMSTSKSVTTNEKDVSESKEVEPSCIRPNVNTGRANVNSVRQNVNSVRFSSVRPQGTAVKTSAGYNWRKTRPNSNYNCGSNFVRTDHPLKNIKDKGIFDSRCSGHMTGNKDLLDDFEECKWGSVTFGGSKGYITGVKTTITPMETKMALTKDKEADEVDVTPKTSHLNVVKRIFKYLKGKPNLGLWYPRESSFDLEAFSDSDYAGANLDRKSTTGGC
ncbi:hypothetical protein Tco_0215822 [Tanacetum coccineum]